MKPALGLFGPFAQVHDSLAREVQAGDEIAKLLLHGSVRLIYEPVARAAAEGDTPVVRFDPLALAITQAV
ncbi:hypothetical protein D3C71_1927780 [compost metagenome]